MPDGINESYYAIIPANVRYDENLTPNAKLLYGEITALCNKKGYCWASNGYFAKLYSVSNTTVSKWIKSLVECGYITSKIIYKEGTKEIENRYLSIVNTPIVENDNRYMQKEEYPIDEKLNTPIDEKLNDNITSINNTINNTSNKEKEKKESINYQAIVDAYKSTCVDLPTCRTLSESRKRTIRARLRSGYTLDDFNTLFAKAQSSDFLKGKNDRGWIANFDWLIKDSNMAKVLDGNYDNRKQINQEPQKPSDGYHIPGLIEL